MKRPRPRKVIATVLVFLLLGAIVNVAVAWWCAVRPVTEDAVWSHSSRKYHKSGSPLLLSRSAVWGRQYFHRTWWTYEFDETAEVDAVTFRSMYPSWSWCDDSELSNPKLNLSDTRFLHEMASGWPFLSLDSWCLLQIRFPANGFAEHHGSFPLPPLLHLRNGFTRVPYLPTWPGFATNTLIYAAFLWLLFNARLMLPYARRRRRIKRGLCPACTYPVGTSDLCTECGKPIPAPLIKRARSQANHFPESPSSL